LFCYEFLAIADRVLLEPVEEEKVTESGIYLPDTAKEKPVMAKVVEIGPGKTNDEGKLIPLTVKQGDVVVFSKYSGTEVKVGDKNFLIVSENDILAKQN
jgi:chaperonin GroES